MVVENQEEDEEEEKEEEEGEGGSRMSRSEHVGDNRPHNIWIESVKGGGTRQSGFDAFAAVHLQFVGRDVASIPILPIVLVIHQG